jgi:hypothetical protein
VEGNKGPRREFVDQSYTEINMSTIRVGGGVAGLIFALGTVYVFVIGLPVVRTFFLWSLLAGAVIATALHIFHKHKPPRPLTKIPI